MTILHSSLGPNPHLVRIILSEKGLSEGSDFTRVHYDIITGVNRVDAEDEVSGPDGKPAEQFA